MPLSSLLLQTVNETVNDLSLKLDHSEPKIFTAGVDVSKWSKLTKAEQKEALSKKWFVYYSFRDPETGRLKRQPHIKAGVNRLTNMHDRMRVLKLLQNKLSLLLQYGFSPYKDNHELEKKLFNNQTKKKTNHSKQKKSKTKKEDPYKVCKEKPKRNKSLMPIQDDPVEEQTSIAEALDFALALKKNMMKHNSFSRYKSRIGQFRTWLDDNYDANSPISFITKKIVNSYLNKVFLRTSARTRNNARTDIASLYQLLEDNEIVDLNFVKSIPKLKTKPTRNKTFTPQQEKKIYKYLEKKDFSLLLMIKFISYNFLRPIEVCRLQIKDVDIKNKRLNVRAKNQLVKIKIIPDILLKDIPDLTHKSPEAFLFGRLEIGQEWAAIETNRRNEYSKRFKVVKDHFGMGKEFGLYSFRHTFITKLYRKFREKFTPFESKSKLMLITGHTTMSALEKYLRDIDAELPEDYSHLFE